MTLKVIPQGHSPFVGLFKCNPSHNFVQHFTRFQLTARSRGLSATAGLLVIIVNKILVLRPSLRAQSVNVDQDASGSHLSSQSSLLRQWTERQYVIYPLCSTHWTLMTLLCSLVAYRAAPLRLTANIFNTLKQSCRILGTVQQHIVRIYLLFLLSSTSQYNVASHAKVFPR